MHLKCNQEHLGLCNVFGHTETSTQYIFAGSGAEQRKHAASALRHRALCATPSGVILQPQQPLHAPLAPHWAPPAVFILAQISL